MEKSRANSFRLARWGRYLLVARDLDILAIPLDEKERPNPEIIHILGPEIGDSVLGYPHQKRHRKISALIPGHSEVFICLDDWYGDGIARNTYGGIYGWNPETAKVRKLCSSDSFSPGPLNDCLPYHVFAGCSPSGGETTYFCIAGAPTQPHAYEQGQRHGIWAYTSSDESWSQCVATDFGYARSTLISPLDQISANMLTFGTTEGSYVFDLAAKQITKLQGLLTHPEAPHGWQHKNSIRDGLYLEEVFPAEDAFRSELPALSFNPNDFKITAVLPTENGFLVLLCYRGSSRGVLCFIPCYKK